MRLNGKVALLIGPVMAIKGELKDFGRATVSSNLRVVSRLESWCSCADAGNGP